MNMTVKELLEKDILEKDGFTLTMSHYVEEHNETTGRTDRHPVQFTQWEARYVNKLEYENSQYKRENRALLQIIREMEDRHSKNLNHIYAKANNNPPTSGQ